MSWRDNLRDEVARLAPYRPEPPGVGIHLDANESPYDLGAAERAALLDVVRALPLHRYPEPGVPRLREVLAARLGVEPSWVTVGNGSDEFLPLLCTVFGRARAPGVAPSILIPVPTFSMYRLCALPLGFDVHEVPRGEGFAIDAEALGAAVRATKPNLVFLANPDNPTGALVPRAAVLAALAQRTSVVVIDEAYAQFAGPAASHRDVVREDEDAVLLGSLSKVGFAALRLGYLVGHPALVAEIDKVRLPYNVDAVSAAAATILLTRHAAELEARVVKVVAERTRLSAALRDTGGVTVFDGYANFVLIRVAAAAEVAAALRARGIIVRNLGRPGPLHDCLRITVGTPDENDAFLSALTELLAT